MFNLVLILIWKIPPLVEPGPGVSLMDEVGGTMPFPVPFWLGLIPILVMGALLIVCWRPSRHKRLSPVGAKLLLRITPRFIAFLLFITGMASMGCAGYYPPLDGSLSWWKINAWLAIALALVAFIHGVRTAPFPFFFGAKRAEKKNSRKKSAKRSTRA